MLLDAQKRVAAELLHVNAAKEQNNFVQYSSKARYIKQGG